MKNRVSSALQQVPSAPRPQFKTTKQIIAEENASLQQQIQEKTVEFNGLKGVTNAQKVDITNYIQQDQHYAQLKKKQEADFISLELPVSFASHSQYLSASIDNKLDRSNQKDEIQAQQVLQMHEMRFRSKIEEQEQLLVEIKQKKFDKDSLIRDLVDCNVFQEFKFIEQFIDDCQQQIGILSQKIAELNAQTLVANRESRSAERTLVFHQKQNGWMERRIKALAQQFKAQTSDIEFLPAFEQKYRPPKNNVQCRKALKQAKFQLETELKALELIETANVPIRTQLQRFAQTSCLKFPEQLHDIGIGNVTSPHVYNVENLDSLFDLLQRMDDVMDTAIRLVETE